ncbi:F510_1955 family glycosylhydrolase [Alkalihalobacillus sp. AL-G]|uniref:F510_1955 family glycosylhydrolase n=1 Tax=Alkalihalobacillus sp. AL-G TaxID=2926399 RepID=UPI00272D401A|nr:VPS10, VPS10 domain protein [Alkalihalobacillus sp. AL-G]WLD92749.1 VPS10, VPS10 domain protein [Alkalihalobacillus sp. AL-G]
MKMKWTAALLLAVLLVVTGCGNQDQATNEEASDKKENNTEESVEHTESETNFAVDQSDYYKMVDEFQVDHIHGLGYAGSDNTVFIASHGGLVAVKDEQWYRPKDNQHDFMGFSATENGFYSSGHPGEGSDLPNPIGLVKSTNGGERLEKLGFTGQSDFHYMTVGYKSRAIYLFNEHPNDQLDVGMYYSMNDGADWKKSELKGLPQNVAFLFAHPSDKSMIGLTSNDGVYVSTDNGDNFERFTKSAIVMAAHFSEKSLFYATAQGKLYEQSLSDKSDLKEWKLPEIGKEETISFLAQNPQKKDEITFITAKNNVFQTTDGGETWTQLTKEGGV